MYSSHNEVVFMNQSAKCWCSLTIAVLTIQGLFEIYMLVCDDVQMGSSYPIYFFFDMALIIPQLFCMSVFHLYKASDGHVKRAFTPIASCIMIVITSVLFF